MYNGECKIVSTGLMNISAILNRVNSLPDLTNSDYFIKVKVLFLFFVTLNFQCFFAFAEENKLPDWSGVWERYEGNGGMFDVSTTRPSDGMAGSPGVRQFPPLTVEWEKKYKENLLLVEKDRLPDPISYCGTPAGFPRLLALPDVYEFIVRPETTWIITENGPNIMRIYTDGRELPAENERWNTYTGESVGKWQDGMLTFKTISMIGDKNTVLDGQAYFERTS